MNKLLKVGVPPADRISNKTSIRRPAMTSIRKTPISTPRSKQVADLLGAYIERPGTDLFITWVSADVINRVAGNHPSTVEGSFGWAAPAFERPGVWQALVSLDIVTEQTADLADDLLSVYLSSVAFWVHTHRDYYENLSLSFVDRENIIEMSLLDINLEYLNVVSHVRAGILDRSGQ